MAEEVTDPGLLAILNGQSATVRPARNVPGTPASDAVMHREGATLVDLIPDVQAQPLSGEVTDPELLKRLNAAEPVAEQQPTTLADVGQGVAEGAASLGTGLLRGGLSTAMMPFDVMNMTRRALGQQPQFPGTEEAGNFMKDVTGAELYEPKNRWQRDITAAGEMVPAVLSRNTQAILAALGGGALGQEMSHEWPKSPMFADAPWSRAMGNVAGMVGTAAAMHPKLSAKLAIQAIPGGRSAWTSTVENAAELARALEGGGATAGRPLPLPERPAPLPPTSKAGQVEDLAGALLRPKVPYDLPQQISNLAGTKAFGYLKALWRALGVPEIQYQANQSPAMNPGAIIGQ